MDPAIMQGAFHLHQKEQVTSVIKDSLNIKMLHSDSFITRSLAVYHLLAFTRFTGPSC